MDKIKNYCLNGDFEILQEAASRYLPLYWDVKCGTVTVSSETNEGKWSLHFKAGDGICAIKCEAMPVNKGALGICYKGDAFLTASVIGLKDGLEKECAEFVLPSGEVDSGWRKAEFPFEFGDNITHCFIILGINEDTSGEILVDSVYMSAAETTIKINLANVWSDKPLAYEGDDITFTAFIENSGPAGCSGIEAVLNADGGIFVCEAEKHIENLAAGDYIRIDWSLKAKAEGYSDIKIGISSGNDTFGSQSINYRIFVAEKIDKYSRQQLCTDEKGFAHLLEQPETLQSGNENTLSKVKHLTSKEIKHSSYGICGHIPREKDYEDPYNCTHLIDGDPETCWSGQQRNRTYPGNPPYVIIEMPEISTVKGMNFIPYWNNSDFPIGFTVKASCDGENWLDVLSVRKHTLVQGDEKRGDKFVRHFEFNEQVSAKLFKFIFERLPLSGGNYAEVSQGYKARLSGIEILDIKGNNLALAALGAIVSASDIFTAWQNTAKTVNESFDKIMEIGLKWIRISQWGDQTEWAAVEREKGVYKMDPVTDAAINELCSNGVDILYGLDYGNSLYEQNEPYYYWDIGPKYKEGHPFGPNKAPMTDEGRKAFVNYVDFLIRKYGDKITWWELWNEQNGWFNLHKPDMYGKLLYEVGKHMKETDPSLKLMYGGTAAPAPAFTEISLREGGGQFVDGTAFHPYGIPKPEAGMGTMEFNYDENLGKSAEQTGWKCLEDVINGVKEPFRKYGRDVEVWMNEWGTNVTGLDFTYNPVIGEYGCAKYLTRFYIYGGYNNAPTAWWALYNDNMSQDWGIVDRKTYALRPMSFALQNVCSLVSDVTKAITPEYTYKGVGEDVKVIAYTRDDSNEKLILCWAADLVNDEERKYISSFTFKLPDSPSEVKITDIYWGITQKADYGYKNGVMTINGFILRDYPIMISYI